MEWIEERSVMPNINGEYRITGYTARSATGGSCRITCMYVGDKPAFQYSARLATQFSGTSVVYDLESAQRGAVNALIFLKVIRDRKAQTSQ
jgi:hypothetical protein